MSNRLKGIYLASFIARHNEYDLVYQDIDETCKPNISGDMLEVDLTPYDFIIATPPCNYWSRANYRRDVSPYALKTRHLLIDILDKLCKQDKPFIVENVRNTKLFLKYGLFDKPCYVYFVGRHTYWSNVYIDFSSIEQKAKIDFVNGRKRYLSSQNLSHKQRQGGDDVHEVIDFWLKEVCKNG